MSHQISTPKSCCSAKPVTKSGPSSAEKSELAANELEALKNKLRWCALFAVPLIIVSMLGMFAMPMAGTSMSHQGIGHTLGCILQLVLATPVLFISGDFFKQGVESVKNKRLNMFTLLSLGIAIPYGYSLVAMALGEHMLYFESSAMIATLSWLGQYLEAKARYGTTEAIRAMASLLPDESSLLLDDGSEVKVKTSAIVCGDKLRLRPGEKIAVDGYVVEGSCLVDESMMTGESMPVTKQSRDQVKAGTVVISGSMDVIAEQVGDQTILHQIIELVSVSLQSRVPLQQTVDKIAAVFVPVIITVAAITFGAWYFSGAGAVDSLWRAVAVLLVSCPCALGLATPVSIVTASGRAAQAGILFKDAAAMQILSRVDTLVIDKTGTLTLGQPVLQKTARVASSEIQDSRLWSMVAALESKSEHPLALAIVEGIRKMPGSQILECNDFDSLAGYGVLGEVDGKRVIAGSLDFLKEMDVNLAGVDTLDAPLGSFTAVYVAVDGKLEARLDLSDQVKPEAKLAIDELKERGINVHIATGDNTAVAMQVANELGIKEENVHAFLSPADKASLVTVLKSSGACVAMAGDGINDAPSLACANVSFAMGDGTNIAQESADIILVKGDLKGILRAMKLSNAMLGNIKQNLLLAFAYNLLAIPAAAGLYLALGLNLALGPVASAAAMSLSSIVVVLNALRLRRLPL